MRISLILIAVFILVTNCQKNIQDDYPIQSVPFTKVKVNDNFWPGKFCSVFPFDDSDVYKIIEGAAYSLHTYPDVQLEKYCDSIIRIIELTQEADGYLMTWRQIDPSAPPTSWSGDEERWSDISGGHELYNMGHLYEAAVAYYQATGKRQLLDVALKMQI